MGREDSLFAGSDGGAARHRALVARPVACAKLNGVEPQAWLAGVLEHMVSGRTEAGELARLLPWRAGRPSGARLRSVPECHYGQTTLVAAILPYVLQPRRAATPLGQRSGVRLAGAQRGRRR